METQTLGKSGRMITVVFRQGAGLSVPRLLVARHGDVGVMLPGGPRRCGIEIVDSGQRLVVIGQLPRLLYRARV